MSLSDRDKAVLMMMAEFKLKPGQMLFVGPHTQRVLVGEAEHKGLKDMFTMEKSEWNKQP